MSNEQELLIEILDTLRRLGDSSDKYFSQIGEREIINPFQDDVQIGTNGNKQSSHLDSWTSWEYVA